MNDDKQTNNLVDESHFPLDNALGQPLDYKQILESDLLELMGADKVSDEDKQEIYETAFKTIENRVLARIIDELTDKDLEEFENIPESDGEAIAKFLQERGIELEKLYAMEAITYKSELASLTHQLKISK